MPSSLLASGAVIEQASRGPVRRAPSAGLEHLQGPPSSVIRASAPSFLPVAELNVCLLWVTFSDMSMCVCRWWAGEWEACSATCGPHGEKKRTVLCIQTMGSDEQQALPAQDCQHLLKPKTLTSCNRDVLCPSDWTVGNWSQVSSGVKKEGQRYSCSVSPPYRACFPFSQDLPLACPVVKYPPGMSWILLAQTHDRSLKNPQDFCWPIIINHW